MKSSGLKLFLAVLIAVGLFLGGYFFNQSTHPSRPTAETINQKKDYYISFDDYYYEVPKPKTVNDRLIPGGQFLYNIGVAVKTNTLEDIFNDGAIAVQALIPLGGDTGAFERYINESVKPSAASAFKGTAEVTFSTRQRDGVRTSDVISKKDGVIVRRQYIINLPQSVTIIAKDDSEAFRKIGDSADLASAKFSDFNKIKLLVMSQSFMLSNRMFDQMYQLAHDDLRNATSVEELNRLADKSKDIFTMEAKVPGVELNNNEMTATIYFVDASKPANNKTASFTFRSVNNTWKLFGLKLPNGSVTGAVQDQTTP